MIQFKWTISQMDTAPSENGLTDVVKVIHWRYGATEVDGDKTYYGDSYGAMNCETPSETDFTAYPDLSEDKVISWLEAGLNVEAMQAGLVSQIEYQKNPPIIVLPLPWTPEPVAEIAEPLTFENITLDVPIEPQAPSEETVA